ETKDLSLPTHNFDVNKFITSGYVKDIVYAYGNQSKAFAKAIFNIKLPRKIVRGSKIVISGDFEEFLTSKYDQKNLLNIHEVFALKCKVNFCASLDLSNYIVEGCDTSNINPENK